MLIAAVNAEPISLQIISCLVEAEADVNYCDEDGTSAMHFAAEFGQLDALKILVEAGASIDAKDNVGCASFLFFHVFTQRENTPIFYAVGKNMVACVKYLIEIRADLTVTNTVF